MFKGLGAMASLLKQAQTIGPKMQAAMDATTTPSSAVEAKPPLERMRPASRVLVFVYVLLALVYLGWRAGTMNPDAPFFSRLVYGAELFGFAAVGLPLGGNREPLLGAALFRLLLGGDTQIGHGQGGALGRVDETAHRIGGTRERGSHLRAFSHGNRPSRSG